MEKKTVNILGTEYMIEEDESLIKTQADGLTEQYEKRITVRPYKDMLNEEDRKESKENRYKEVIRHEVVHASFIESGLSDYCANEQLVDWIAVQFPKLLKMFAELGAIDISEFITISGNEMPSGKIPIPNTED